MKKDIKTTNVKDYFFCYSLRLFHHLKLHNQRYEYRELNPSTNRYFWVFKRTEELNELLDVFTKEKQANLSK